MNYFKTNTWRSDIFAYLLLVIWLILLSPAVAQLPTSNPNTPEKASKPQTLIYVMEKAGVFTVFLSAIRQAGLEEKVAKENSLTILAPRDSAFSHVESISRDQLFSSKALLKKFVEQHVLIGNLSFADLQVIDTLLTLGGFVLPIEHKEPIEIGRAKVLRSDINADNGIIFLLDRAVVSE